MARLRAVPAVALNGPALRCIRERSGVSCSALARAVGADVSFLARVERGEKRGVRRETFEALVRELEITDPRAILADPFGGHVTRDIVATGSHMADDELHSACTTSTTRAA